MRFEGIYTPVITPFLDDFSIDGDGFACVVEHLIATGVHGIVLAGTTGEYYAQTMNERVAMMKLAKDVLGNRLPLIVGVGALRTEDAIEYARHAKSAGADCLLLGSPYYAMPTERELAQHVLAVDRDANLPIMLYNYPARTGAMMGPDFLDRVGRSPNFCAIKESSGDVNQLHVLARDYPHIQLCCGMDDQALEFFAWGARSWVCAGSNFLPTEHIALYEACVAQGDFAKGRRIMSAMLPLMHTLEQGGKFVQCIKHGCAVAGLPAGAVRKPLRGLCKEEKRELETVIRVLKTTIARITSQDQKEAANVVALDARGV
jgi:4-hydroxy-tetrahydrodipicolinate synthase